MNRSGTRQWRRWSMMTLALLVLIGVLPLSAQAAANDAQPRFYVDRYYSASLGKEMTYRVYLPEGYYNGNQRYPVVYMLHEEGQSSQEFEDDRIQDSLDQWTADGTIQKMIVVMPDTSADSWFVNQSGGRWEDLIVNDLIPVVDQRYPTIALPAFRGISGVSMGGFGAFVLGMRHPELFGSIASHMGALDRTVGGLQPLALMKGKTAAALKTYQYYLDGGTDDPMTYATNSTNDIHAYFRTNNVTHGYQTRPGGHDNSYFLTYLNRSFMMHSASFAKGLLTGSFTAAPQAISTNDTKVNVNFTVNLNRTSVTRSVYENRANNAFNLTVGLKVTDPGSSAVLYAANTSLGNVVQNSSQSSFTGSFTLPVSALGTLKSTNLTLDAKILGTSFTLGTKPLIRVTPTGTLPEDTQIDLLGDWKFTKDTFPTASINGADVNLDTSAWSVVQPGLDWWTDGFGGYSGLNNYYGAAWYVKKFDVPADFPMDDLTLMAGKIDDADMTYINGQLVGETGFSNGTYTSSFWAASREYAIPSNLLRRGETNTIAVRMYNQNGGGGWYAGPIGIYTKAAAQKIKNLPSKVPSDEIVGAVKALAQSQFAAIEQKDAKAYSATLSAGYFNGGADKLAAIAEKTAWFDAYKSLKTTVQSPYVFELDGRYLYTAQVTVSGTLDDGTETTIRQGAVSQYYALENGAPKETGDQKLFYKTSFYSESAQRNVTFRIYLPPSYMSDPDKRYPSVYLFHQFNSDSESFEIDKIDQILNQGVANGSMKDMIVVMPDSSGTSWWVNGTGPTGVKWQDMVVKDLVPFVDGHYRTIDDSRYRGTTGVSMGGFGSVTIGLLFPNLFSSVASHMGALSYVQQGLDPVAIMKGYPLDALKRYALFLDSGNLDVYKFDVPVNTLHKYLMENGVPHYAEVRDGAHDSAFYTKSIDLSFAQHSRHFSASNAADGALNGKLEIVKDGETVKAAYKVAATDAIAAYADHIPASPYLVEADPQLDIPVVIDIYDETGEKVASIGDKLSTRTATEQTGEISLAQLAKTGSYKIVLKATLLDRTYELGQVQYNPGADNGGGDNGGGDNGGGDNNGGNNGGTVTTPTDPVKTDGETVTAAASNVQAAIDGKSDLQLTAKNGSKLFIPYENLVQFQAAAGTDKVKSLILVIKPISEADQASFLQKGGAQLGGALRAAGEIVDLALTAQLESGSTLPLGQSFSKPVKLQLKVDPNADPELTGIYYLDANGQAQYMGGKWDAATGTVSTELSHFSKYGVMTLSKTFGDVPAGHWSNRAIQVLSAKQIITGITADRFAPAQRITRAEFAALIVRTLGLEADASAANPFSDIAAGTWYAAPVSAAYQHGIVKGKSDALFAPNATITREEMAVMIYNALKASGSNAATDGANNALAGFKDNGEIHAWAKTQMNALVQLGLMSGKSDTVIAPSQTATRAEAAQILYNWTKSANA